ncbi:MAG: transporter suffix domain-containing protein [Gammaproteobacteria bacterium]|nr:MAG: transporter suffix domain-containing protein [Gammaproteobacteria bacterium]
MGDINPGSGRFRRAAGYTLLAVSMLAWPATLTLPLFDITLAEGTAIATTIVVTAEILFLVGLALVGREVWQRLTTLLRTQLEELKKPKPRD